eukprot:TRINITY_DN9845_c0_g1_i3.p1 TRINITY_DN9845_c0_g1~~TRINITY_DN9845_c0_g1_i3.p1  ORF type:complete len:455 (+),score=73.70 TRINITY_DN9845_c0_g1_i3:559-1923(+)
MSGVSSGCLMGTAGQNAPNSWQNDSQSALMIQYVRCPGCVMESTTFPPPPQEVPLSDDALRRLSLQLDREFLNQRIEDGSTGTYITTKPTQAGRYQVQVGNVGDSRVIVGKGGLAFPMTTDHKPSNEGERRRIEAAGGHVESDRVDGRLAVSRAYGDAEYKQGSNTNELTHKVIAVPEITHVECGKEDFIFLSCDGVYERNFSSEEVIRFINDCLATTSDLGVVCSMVCDEALERGSKDNISAMIVTFADGMDYASAGVETRLGPYAARNNHDFRQAYEAALPRDLTLVDALPLRYDAAVAELAARIEATRTNLTANTCDISTLNESQLRSMIANCENTSIDGMLSLTREALEARARHIGHGIPTDIKELQSEIESFTVEGAPPPPKGSVSDDVRRAWFEQWFRNAPWPEKNEWDVDTLVSAVRGLPPPMRQMFINRFAAQRAGQPQQPQQPQQ